MSRYTRIQSVQFGQTSLPLPLSVRFSRRTEAMPSFADSDIFATSVQVGAPVLVAEVSVRGTAVAESLSLGDVGTLSVTIGPTGAGQTARLVALDGAVLTNIELIYEQSAMAVARLQFVAEAPSGVSDPFAAEDEQ